MKIKYPISVILSLLILIGYEAFAFRQSCYDIYVGRGKFGPRYHLDSENKSGKTLAEQLPTLKIFSQNFENLGEFAEHKVELVNENGVMVSKKINYTMEKSENQKRRLAKRIEIVDPDIIVATEVKDLQSGIDFSNRYLGGKYEVLLIEGNDSRGIDVCFFVKKTLNLDLEIESFKDYKSKLNPSAPVFSRDFPVLKLREAGARKDSAPLLAIFGTHLKSRLGAVDGKDKTVTKRGEQVLASMEIAGELERSVPEIGIIITGDHNNDVQKAIEFEPYYRNGFEDTLNLVRNSPPREERDTQYFETVEGGTTIIKKSQLDMAIVNKLLQKFVLFSTIQRDVLSTGEPVSSPTTGHQINRRGSDHDGIVVVLNFAAYLKTRQK